MRTLSLLCLSLLWVGSVMADEVIVVMTTGERFVTSEVWEEDGKIRFNMQGLMVSVKSQEVAGIIRSQGNGYAGVQQQHSVPENALAADKKKNNPLPLSAGPAPAQHPAQPQSQIRRPHKPRQAEGYTVPNASRTSAAGSRMSEEIGLDGLVWRMPPAQIAGLEKIETDDAFGGIEQHWRPDQPLTFNDADLTGLVYGFWNDQLYSIMMWTDGRIGYDLLRSAILARFGPGRQNNANVERYVWVGEETQRMLEFDIKRNTGIFIMRAGRLHAQIRELYPD
jgi:hypothetical protein